SAAPAPMTRKSGRSPLSSKSCRASRTKITRNGSRRCSPSQSRPHQHRHHSNNGGLMDKKFINPPELYKHPSYSRVIPVKGPCKFIFIAGQTPSDDKYQPVHPGDYRKQYEHIIAALTIQLKAAGATWDDVVVRRVFTVDVDALQKAMREPGLQRPEN